MMRFRDKLKSSKEKNTPAARELVGWRDGSRSAPEEWTRGKGKGNEARQELPRNQGKRLGKVSC
jgi:hypothetical protein